MAEHEHHHEGHDDNVRMDVLKVNQKIFNQYPVGSPGRLELVRNKKLLELQGLTEALQNMPAESVNLIAAVNSHHVIFALLRTGVCASLLAAVPFFWRHVPNDMGKVAIGCFSVLMVMVIAENLVLAWNIAKERRALLETYDIIHAKFEAVLKDLEKLNGK